MWMPTHIQVTVQRADGILIKGKNNTNDCFVTIGLGKTKYRTSVKEKAGPQVEWHEECELPIPEQGNTAELVLTAYHQNFLGVDEFLGRVLVPLQSLDIYERPKNKWFTLQSKAGHEGKKKDRGRLEVKIGFTVRSGSLENLSKEEKYKSSTLGQFSHVAHSVGGSLMSLGSAEKRKGIKKFAKSIGSKMNLKGKKKHGHSEDEGSSIGSVSSLHVRNNIEKFRSRQTLEDADPGVVSDDDDFTFDELSHKSSASSLSQSKYKTLPAITKTISAENVSHSENTQPKVVTLPPKPPRMEPKQQPQDEWDSKLSGKDKNTLRPSSEPFERRAHSKLSLHIEEEPDLLDVPLHKEDTKSLKSTNNSPSAPKKSEKDNMFSVFKHFKKDKNEHNMEHSKPPNSNERIIIGGESETKNSQNNHISSDLLVKFEGKSREDLIVTLHETQTDLEKQKKKLRDLEDYLDDLLLRVMETTPRILQNPYVNNKKMTKKIM